MQETPRLNRRIRFSYSVGRTAEGIKSRAFEFFLFFYYVQVLGLSGSLAGLAVGLALIFDSFIDPMIGSYSDNLQSKYGRRHPLMLASVLPLGLSFYFLFSPPDDMGPVGLFFWLLVLSVLARASIALFQVPHLALGAELTDHYTERSAIVVQRTIFAAFGSVFAMLAGLNFFMAPTEQFPTGQLNPDAYSPFALAMSLSMAFVILFCCHGTRGIIPSLKQTRKSEFPGSLALRSYQEFLDALRNKSFRALFTGILLVAVVGGVHSTLALHMATYYWELSQEETSGFLIAAGMGFLAGLIILRRAHERFDKKHTFATGMALLALLTAIGPGLREIGLFPGNDHPALFPLLLVLVAIATFFGALAGVSGGSMMADIADEHELTHGRRQEGIFFSAASFAGKAAGGAGHIIAGVVIDIIGFPSNAAVGTISPENLTQLGLMNGPLMAVIMAFGVVYFMRYELSHERHAQIMQSLRERSALAGASPGPDGPPNQTLKNPPGGVH